MSTMLEIPPPKAKAYKKKLGIFILMLLLLASVPLWLFFTAIKNDQNTLYLNLISVPMPVTSPLEEVFVNHGSFVQKGQNLARLQLSGYDQNLAHAMALTQGAYGTNPSSAQTAQRVNEAQGAEADTVQRITLARHEENTQRLLVEQLSVDHAKALLQLRGMEAINSQNYRTAQQKELQLRQELERARATFEIASRSRSAIEGELYKIRAERQRSGQNIPTYSLSQTQRPTISDAIVAPEEGYIIGAPPLTGQALTQNSTLFTLIPSTPRFYVRTQLPEQQALLLASGAFAFIHTPSGSTFEGTIVDILPDAAGKSTVTVEISGAELSFEEVLEILQGNTQNTDGENARLATRLQVDMVFWPKDTLTTTLEPLIRPLLSLYQLL